MTLETTLQSEDLFDSLESEEEQEVREFKYEETRGLKLLIRTYGKWLRGRPNTPIKYLLARKNYSAKDVTGFSHYFREQNPKLSYNSFYEEFLKNAIYGCKEKEITIFSWDKLWLHVRDSKAKSIIIFGDIKNLESQNKGKITVHGNIYDYTGLHMRGGKLIVHGDVKDVGMDFSGDEIHIHGSVGRIGGMYGGKIFVDGDINEIIHAFHGNVYQKGKLIIKDGKEV